MAAFAAMSPAQLISGGVSAPCSRSLPASTGLSAVSTSAGWQGVRSVGTPAAAATAVILTAAASRMSKRQRRQRAHARTTPATTQNAVPKLHVGVVGYGLVGKELVSQLLGGVTTLEEKLGVRAEVSGVARSSTMVLLAAGASSELSGGAWPAGEEPVNLEKFAEHLLAAASASGGRALIVDNTASDAPAEFYESWLAKGIDVVTPNKRAGSGPFPRYERILAAARSGGSRFLYEATVGAGLPILGPVQGLVSAGDEIQVVQGIFSGTLSYIFNTWQPGQAFSEVVADAKDKGFTEPDPRDDLGGTDVQRKVTILARELGLKLELDDVPVQSLVPEALRDWQPSGGASLGDAFVEELKAFDGEMGKLIEEAAAANEVLRFVGKVDVAAGKGSVVLGRFAKDHPFAATQFADNIVAVDSKWYSPRPLVIQGPGAGAAVTAAGVFGNILEVMHGMRR